MRCVPRHLPQVRRRDLIGAWLRGPDQDLSTGGPAVRDATERGLQVIVLGIDPHKTSHTAVAVEAATGELLADHRDDLVAERTRIQGRLRWHLHDLGIGAEVPPKALRSTRWLDRVEAQLGGAGGVQARIARELTQRCRELNAKITALGREIEQLAAELAPELLALPGIGGLTAARLVGETAGAARFASAARFAMHSGVAPVPVSSGRTDRYRLNRRGNRRLNCALHRMAVTQMRMHEPARAYLERRRSEGKTKREALRCLKRHLARSVWRALRAAEARREAMLATTTSSTLPALMLAS